MRTLSTWVCLRMCSYCTYMHICMGRTAFVGSLACSCNFKTFWLNLWFIRGNLAVCFAPHTDTHILELFAKHFFYHDNMFFVSYSFNVCVCVSFFSVVFSSLSPVPILFAQFFLIPLFQFCQQKFFPTCKELTLRDLTFNCITLGGKIRLV